MPKTFSFYSLASISLCTFVVYLHLLTVLLHLLTVLVALRHTQTHTQTCTYMYLHISFLWQCQMYAFRPKTLLPRWLPSPVFSQIVCKRVSLAAAAIYFRKKFGFPFTWVQEQDKYCKVAQRCVTSRVGIWGRWDQGTSGQCLLQRCKEQGRACRESPVLLYTSSGLALQATQMCTQVGDTCAYFRHTHSSKFSSTDYLWTTWPSRKKFWCMLCCFMSKVCLSYISLICSLSLIVPHLLPLVVLCIIGVCGVPALLGMQLDSRTCKHRIRTVCMKLP